MKPEELAWAAGLLEGEGSFSWRTSKSPHISCAMTDLDVLERLRSLLGGNIVVATKSQPHHKQAWVWYLGGTPAIDVMRQLSPLMGSRRHDKIEQVIQLWEDHHRDRATTKEAKQQRGIAAALDYQRSGDSFRAVARRHEMSHITVKKYYDRL